jgi:hypothetical protein
MRSASCSARVSIIQRWRYRGTTALDFAKQLRDGDLLEALAPKGSEL